MTVTLWMCPCGTEYKAFSKVNAQTPFKTLIVCPKCRAVADIEGAPIERLEAVGEGQWRTVENKMSGVQINSSK